MVNFMMTIQDRAIPAHTVSVSNKSQYVLEIDFDSAWQEMGLEPGQSNEVDLKISFLA